MRSIGSFVGSSQRRILAIVAVLAVVAAWQVGSARLAGATTPSACDAVVGNLVQNCGFESGDFTGWSVSDAALGTDLAVESGDQHTGDDYAYFGAGEDEDDTITQTLTGLTSGDTYDLSFWLDDATPNHGHEEDFSASLSNTVSGGRTALDIDNPTGSSGFGYQQYTARFTAGATDPTLIFSGANVDGHYGLDDVVVTLQTTPSICDAVADNLVQNCGFETGDLTGWTLTPAAVGSAAGVDDSEDGSNSGDHYFSFGAGGGDDDTLSQSLSAQEGTVYDLSFYVAHDTTGAGFSATIENTASGDVTALSQPSPGISDYTEYTATFTTSISAEPTLVFAGQSNPGWFDLDDVSVTVAPSECDAIAGNLVQNCGFETGDLTDWNLTPAASDSDEGVDRGDVPHSGTHMFGLGATGNDDDAISQTLSGTTPGATYTLSFWLLDTVGGNEPDFFATVEGTASGTVTALSLPNGTPTVVGYVEETSTFVAGGSAPTIVFSGRHDAGWIDIDDVSVTFLNAPPPFVPASPSITVTSSANPGVSGGSETFTATISPVPGCGTVSWLIDNAPTSATASGSGGTFTLGPVSGLSVGTHPVTAVFSGCANGGPANGTALETINAAGSTPPPTSSPTPTPTPTSTGSVTDPTITAEVSSGHPKSKAGWYRSPVTVTFTCTPGSAALTAPCPSPVVLSTSGASQSVTKSIVDSDGGTASVTVSPINIDLVAPTLTVHPRAGTCSAKDGLSGVASCVVHKHRHTHNGVTTVRWTATATDKAGNTRTKRGHYPVG